MDRDEQLIYHGVNGAVNVFMAAKKMDALDGDSKKHTLHVAYMGSRIMLPSMPPIPFELFEQRMYNIAKEKDAVKFSEMDSEIGKVYAVEWVSPLANCNHPHHIWSGCVMADKDLFNKAKDLYYQAITKAQTPGDAAAAKTAVEDVLKRVMH
jgi:hypothetical protein